MAETTQQKDLDVSEVYTKTELFVDKNKKPLTIGAGVLVAIVLVVIGYQQFVVKPKTAQALEDIWKAQYYFEIDSLDLALNGDGQWMGFEAVADEYGSTPLASWPMRTWVPFI